MLKRTDLKQALVDLHGEPEDLDQLAWTIINIINDRGYTLDGFAWDMVYRNNVSNSHSSPINGVESWSKGDNVPDGYPGWVGRVWVRYNPIAKEQKRSTASDPFYWTFTHTGTGGYGTYEGPWHRTFVRQYHRYGPQSRLRPLQELDVYSWHYQFFIDDWPGVKYWKEKHELAEHLGLGGREIFDSHRFEWTHPDALARDKQFLQWDDNTPYVKGRHELTRY